MGLSEETKQIQTFIATHHDLQEDMSDFYMQLIDCIVDHNHLYYIENNPIISDKEYDELFSYLKKIEEHFPQIITSNSPTQTLIGQVSEWFIQAKHDTKLLSLENTYNAQDLKDWEERIKKILDQQEISYTIEPKFDGLSVELVYEKWIFKQAITRGDGRVGEDVTVNVQTIKNIPKRLDISSPDRLSVRGEIVMPKSVRKEINKEREENGETPFANTRNAAAWSIKLLNSWEVAKRGLLCYVYDILNPETLPTKDMDIEHVWFHTFKRKKTAKDIQEIISLCEDPATKKTLEEQDIEFDGLVIKVQDKQQREDIWATEHHPRWAVAYKFPAQLAVTQILSVDVQVGRTGILTPVANFEPVQLSWAKLQRVSLHNFDFIKEKDIHIQDRIRLQRSGEVIPYIVSVITDRRTGQETEINPPKHCPSCQEPVTNSDMHYYCTNYHCPDKIKQQIQHFVSKNCMDIQGIGESSVDILVDNKIIENIADIYKLRDHTVQIQLRRFPWFGDKKVAEISQGIEESKHKALRRLLNGLGIPHVGKKIAQDISKLLTSENISEELTNREFLVSIYGIGEKTVENIREFFENKDNIAILKQLEEAWINMDPHKYTNHIEMDELKGSFSITWSFDVSRKTITEYFQRNWYIFNENPTKTTDFILIGKKASSKKTKAQELWITIYEWWSNIINKFPFMKNISTEAKNKPTTQSLF